MSFKFDLMLVTFLDSKTDRCLLLGDVGHGKKSLTSLKTTAVRLELDLKDYKVLILVEGPKNGEILPSDEKDFADLKKHGADVRGCEDNLSLCTLKEIEAFQAIKFELANGPESIYNKAHAKNKYNLEKRILDANKSWEILIATEKLRYKKIILCCGTSHLPAFVGNKFENEHPIHPGLMNAPSLKASLCAFTVEASNDGAGWYRPEKLEAPGSFAKVRTIE
ncbi:hypothetical protein [Massilia aquatica]|uniref:Uncharacterized protein n=1 Tax=Massilia aquatica TaxID=2609000 RepID=A0ABX0MA02_9BURK|nr:hypothetical protein [Massilia aquatica]NHZ44009.1 hypothetical protein [Massilia aquatica]